MADRSFETARSGIRAEVRVRDRIVRYERRGGGAPVLLLGAPGGDDTLWPHLADVLATRYRLLVPELPESDDGCADWLGDFLEGLGARGVRLIASPEYSATAVELTLVNADSCAALVIVPVGRSESTENAGELDTGVTPSREAPVPVLIVRRGTAEESAVASVVGFLGALASEEVAARGY